MSSLTDFADICAQTIIWEQKIGRDNYGKPLFSGTLQTFRGRRSFKVSRVAAYERGTKGQGAELISESQIWILAAIPVGYDDRIYVSGDVAPFPPILSIQRIPDETGQDYHTKLYLGSANG